MSSRRLLPRRRRIALAVAAVAVVAVCFLADLRRHPTGGKRTLLWGAGLIAYAVLLDGAVGPPRDRRDPSGKTDFPGSGDRSFRPRRGIDG